MSTPQSKKEEPVMGETIVCNVLDQDELRCFCGSLIARICAAGVELKCRRCKRFHIIPISSEKDK